MHQIVHDFSYRNINFHFIELGSPERFRISRAPPIAIQMAEIFSNKIIRILKRDEFFRCLR